MNSYRIHLKLFNISYYYYYCAILIFYRVIDLSEGLSIDSACIITRFRTCLDDNRKSSDAKDEIFKICSDKALAEYKTVQNEECKNINLKISGTL